MMGKYYVYILTNQYRTVLYTGVTNNLKRRLTEHDENIRLRKTTFAARYKCRHLLYFENYVWVQEDIAREKEIKGWVRVKKMELIKTTNPDFEFLEDNFLF